MDSRDELRKQLARLIRRNESPAVAIPQSEHARGHGDEKSPDNQNVLSEFDSVTQTVEHILALFEQIHEQNQGLSQELLGYYEQINSTFHATTSFAHCRTVQQMLPALMHELTQAVQACFTYYYGPRTLELNLSHAILASGKDSTVVFAEESLLNEAQAFYTQHREELLPLVNQAGTEPAVSMVGYNAKAHYDHAGKGNVLVLKLIGPDTKEWFGTMVLVRMHQQEPFSAVELGLSNSIAQMGMAVLDNISYARKLQEAGLQTVAALVRAMEAKDSYTSGHSSRVSQLATELGRYVDLEESQVQILEWAGLLHDIGKIGIRENVLTKPGRLTKEEFEHIKSHPVQSCNVLEPIESLRNVIPAVRHHHEHWDGSGYPDGLVGEDIPLLARILQIADVYDALTSNRSYRQAMTDTRARQVLRSEAGTTLDPRLVGAFLKLLDVQAL